MDKIRRDILEANDIKAICRRRPFDICPLMVTGRRRTCVRNMDQEDKLKNEMRDARSKHGRERDSKPEVMMPGGTCLIGVRSSPPTHGGGGSVRSGRQVWVWVGPRLADANEHEDDIRDMSRSKSSTD